MRQQSYGYNEGEIQYLEQWSIRTETSIRNLWVSIFRSGAVNEHVLIVCPLTTRSQWRGRRHILACPEGRNDHVRQGEAINDRQVGASSLVLPPVGMF
jgi:hypothetical protein